MSFGVTFWITVGFVLIIAEIFSLNLVLLFFGLSALVVALAKSLGLANLTAEIILFALAGLGSLLFFRKKLKKGLASRRELSIDLNAAVVVAHDMAPHESSSIDYQGSTWTAVNESDSLLKKGTRAYIHGTDGVKLVLKAEPLPPPAAKRDD